MNREILDYAKNIKVGTEKYLAGHIKRLFLLSTVEANTIARLARA